MSVLTDIFVGKAHGYTASDTPWIIGDESRSIYGKLVYYLSGGGMKAFGRSVHQEEVRRRHRRFVIVLSLLAAVWSVFYFL